MLLTQEGVLVSSFHRWVVMSTSTPKRSSNNHKSTGLSSSSSSSSSSGRRTNSKVTKKEADFINFKGKKLGVEGVQGIRQQYKMDKLVKGELSPKDFEPKYVTRAADDSFDEQLTSLNKKSNELLTDLKHVYLKLRVLTEVSLFFVCSIS